MIGEPRERRFYRSIFLSPSWAHQRYLGWSVALEAAGIRLLQRRRGPLTKNLVLLTAEGRDGLPAALNATAAASLSEIVVHDFDGVLGNDAAVGGVRFREAEVGERLLNVATIAIDLTVDETELFAGMHSTYRRKIRQAERRGITVEAHGRPPWSLLQRFVRALRALAIQKGFDAPTIDAVRKMLDAGDALLLVARKGESDLNYLCLYRAEQSAYFMGGVNLAPGNDGSSKLIHWKAIQVLKERGYEWYDLGGVSTQNPDDGIYNFKRKFGGQFVPLGTEWRYTSAMTTHALEALRTLRRIRRGWTRRAVAAKG